MSNKNIVITGASSGIGAAIAKCFSEAGFNVILLSRSLEKMQSLAISNSHCFSVDVTNAAAVQQVIQDIETNIGEIDCLINNAGYAKSGEFAQQDVTTHNKMVSVNLMGVIYNMEAVLPFMQERRSGTIINISSIADRKTRPQLATYAATKSAVSSLTESLRAANAKYNIRITNVAPALIKTPMLQLANLQKKDDDLIAVDDFAQAILWIYQWPQTICIRDIVIAPTSYEK